MYGHFLTYKTQILIKKGIKKDILFDWVYAMDNIDLFIADGKEIRFMKVDEEKRSLKQIKSISGKYNSFLYDPLNQVLAVFPVGDCKLVYTYCFEENKAKNWYKGPQIHLHFENDQILLANVKKNKSLGLKNSTIHC